jgi:hypothetical protein
MMIRPRCGGLALAALGALPVFGWSGVVHAPVLAFTWRARHVRPTANPRWGGVLAFTTDGRRLHLVFGAVTRRCALRPCYECTAYVHSVSREPRVAAERWRGRGRVGGYWLFWIY